MQCDVTTVTQRIKLNGKHSDEEEREIRSCRQGKGPRSIAGRERQAKGCRSAAT